MKKQEEKIEIIQGSGNIYKDFGFKDSEELVAKAELAIKINEIIKNRDLTQKEIAEILDVDQPKVSALKNGRLKGFSLERLLTFVRKLNYTVQITAQSENQNVSESFAINF